MAKTTGSRGEVKATNLKMLRLLEKMAPRRRSTFAEGVCHIELDLADTALPGEGGTGDP
jgi:hypothetical protein